MRDSALAAICRGFTLGHQVAARVACARAQIDHKIRAANGVFVVLHDEDGIAQIAKLFERAKEAVVVARVQPDGRLIEHIQHAAQARSDLRREADALRFPAGKRSSGAVQAEIAEPDREQKIQALGNFFQRASRNFALARGELR